MDKFCIITTKRENIKVVVPIERCSFKYRTECSSHGQDIITEKFYITVLVEGTLDKKDFLRYKKLKKEKVVTDYNYGDEVEEERYSLD